MLMPANLFHEFPVLVADRLAGRLTNLLSHIIEKQFEFMAQHQHFGDFLFDFQEALFGYPPDIVFVAAFFVRHTPSLTTLA